MLKYFTYGTYQISLSPSYIQDTVLRIDEEEEEQALQINERLNEPGFLRCRLYSRFQNAVRHQLFISFNEQYNKRYEGNAIVGHYCTCKTGARTLGSCSHVAAVLWYLGYARHEENVKYPSTLILLNVTDVRDVDYENEIQVLD